MISYGCQTFIYHNSFFFFDLLLFPHNRPSFLVNISFSSLLWSILILLYMFSGVLIFILIGNNVVPFIISSHSDLCMFINIYVDVVVSFPFPLFFNLLLLSPSFFIIFLRYKHRLCYRADQAFITWYLLCLPHFFYLSSICLLVVILVFFLAVIFISISVFILVLYPVILVGLL